MALIPTVKDLPVMNDITRNARRELGLQMSGVPLNQLSREDIISLIQRAKDAHHRVCDRHGLSGEDAEWLKIVCTIAAVNQQMRPGR